MFGSSSTTRIRVPAPSLTRAVCSPVPESTLRIVREPPIAAAARSPVILLAMQELASLERGEAQLETELTYDGLTPVPVRVTKRDGRYKGTDDGGAVSAAGVAGRRVASPDHIAFGEHSVNVTRQGIVW